MATNTYQITAVMPSLNEERNLEAAVSNVIASFERFGIRGEIVIVNDGSRDGTGRLAEELRTRHSFVQVVHHERPEGIGGSFWDGVAVARGEAVVMVPGDGENDADEILQYLPLMDQVDLVVPFVYNREVRARARRVLSKLYRGIINLSFGTTLNYMNGTVLYRKSVLQGLDLRARGFFYQTELLVKCIRSGYLYAEVPSALLTRSAGRSKATSLRSLKNVLAAYFALLADVYAGGRGGSSIAPDSRTAARRKAQQ